MHIKYAKLNPQISRLKIVILSFSVVACACIGLYVLDFFSEHAQKPASDRLDPTIVSSSPPLEVTPAHLTLTVPRVDPFMAAASRQRSEVAASPGATDCVALVAAYRQSLTSCKTKDLQHKCALDSLKAQGFDAEKYDICSLFKPSPMTSPFG
jgi:hypothetical protein